MPVSLPSIKKVKNLAGKVVLVRVVFNVPMEGKKVADDSRIQASLPTIQYLVEKKAKVIIATHLGRPDGKVVDSLKLDPVAKRLSSLLKVKVKKMAEVTGPRVEVTLQKMQPGEVLMLENVRFSSDEKNETGELSKQLAEYADVFVLDGFAVAHRAAASVSGVPRHIPGYAGLLLEREVAGLDTLLHRPKAPFVVILGGAKMETKIPVLKNLLPRATCVLLGGGVINTYFKARGYGVGDSLLNAEYVSQALRYCRNRKAIVPLDVVVGRPDGRKSRIVKVGKKPHTLCEPGEGIFDIGPATIELYKSYIQKAKTLVWNGAMGYFEQQPYDTGTLAIARLVAAQSKGKAFGVVGGGETVQALEMVHMSDAVDLVSTGGGAMLEYLSDEKLPGIEVLKRRT